MTIMMTFLVRYLRSVEDRGVNINLVRKIERFSHLGFGSFIGPICLICLISVKLWYTPSMLISWDVYHLR